MVNHDMLGIDWGTSNRRAYLIDESGTCIKQQSDDQGLLNVGGRFAESLSTLRQRMQIDVDVPVVMSGMVGSALGWQEVPYLDIDVPLVTLPRLGVRVKADPNCVIVPGYRCAIPDIDVMRGEEMQLLGAASLGYDEGWIVLPGTHSKWAHLQSGRIERFSTYMTGELFAQLSASGTLAPLIGQGEDDVDAFVSGLRAAAQNRPLSSALFGIRARVVTGNMPANVARSYASGLLIGAEFAAARGKVGALPEGQTVHLIGSPGLAARYRAAATHFGMYVVALDPDQIYLAALKQFSEGKHDEAI